MSHPNAPHVTYVVPRLMGGMLNIVAHLLAHRRPDGFSHRAVLTENPLVVDTPFTGELAADRVDRVRHTLPRENLFAALRRLRRVIPTGPGVLVANDWIELAMLWWYDPGATVVQILHGDHDYYWDLARRHAPVIDVHVTYSRALYERLRRQLPERAESILHLPYGIPLPPRVRVSRGVPIKVPADSGKPLQIVFAGRLEHGQKGVFDLPEIAAALAARGVNAGWTVIGGGPDEAALRQRFPTARYLGVLPTDELVAGLADYDAFVLPTRAEGFPVALLEAMGAGLVPVVSDIESGVPEIVTPGVTGFRPPVGDIAGFAEALATLASNPAQLNAFSQAARHEVVTRFDIRDRVADYQTLYARHQTLRRPRPPRLGRPPYGSRLDQPWLPNWVVKGVRRWRRRG